MAAQPQPQDVALNQVALNQAEVRDGQRPAQRGHRGGFWRVLATTFVTIFLAELGDKTQVATLLMSAESGQPWVVFLGAGSALVTTSLVGILVGRWLSRRVPPRTLDTAAGTILLVITLWLLWDVMAL